MTFSRTVLIILSVSVLLFSCSDSDSSLKLPEGRSADEYVIENFGGNGVERARRYNDKKLVIEEGFLVNGKANGSWVEYDVDQVTKISSYVNGILNGLVTELSKREQITRKTNYRNGLKHGRETVHEFGRLLEESYYENGKLEGTYFEYHANGNVKREIQYKNGLQHGIFRYFDQDGNLTLEYEYANGKKVSGGIVPEQ